MKYIRVVFSSPLDTEFLYSVPEKLESTPLFGKRVVVPIASSERNAFVVEDDAANSENIKTKEIKRVVDKEPIFTSELLEVARWMRSMYLTSVGISLSQMVPKAKRESKEERIEDPEPYERIEKLTYYQERALEKLREKEDGIYYIYGVTGSGKSEVYLRRAEEVIKSGKQVLYLVPEISLTEQLKSDVLCRFKNRVAILHSSLTPSCRLQDWHKINKGEIDLVIGTRSAVFAPFKSLGLIILDEEQDSSYKSGSAPRYHTRQVAQHRAKTNKAQFIMGSATPSMESWKLMKTQALTSIVMPERIGSGKLPEMSVVNMKREEGIISGTLEKAIREALDEKKGVILFLNRRGYTYSYVCSNCGEPLQCPHCSVSLTYHKKENKLICHTCGYVTSPLKFCPKCSSRDFAPRGRGTESAEEEVRRLFPLANVERLDRDSAGIKNENTNKILKRFKEGKIDILLGTQIIAKGLNFPSVSLVGILDADSSLYVPDFRASERTFDLLEQVSGRAGRFRPDGRVIIQTLDPLSPAIALSLRHDVSLFYERELQNRRETMFPPYTRLINLTLRGRDQNKTENEANRLENIAVKLSENYSDVEIFSASPCIIEKKANQYRYHVLLRSDNISQLLNFTHHLLSEYKKSSAVYLEVDVDPLDLM